ncbi:MAG TPA: hypothetical protein VGG72_23190 [Bryobacteraceae bacterium]|jgi:hypothetical protein
MQIPVLHQVKQALTNLNPGEVRESAMKPVRVGLVAASQDSLAQMEAYLVPPHLSPQRRLEALQMLQRGSTENCDVVIYDSSLLRSAQGFSLDLDAPEDCLRRILKSHDNLLLPLARQFYPFRKPAAQQVIRSVAKENAMFALATALPDVVPFLGWTPWAIGEFGSDAAFLTMNQIRMAFLLAGLSDRSPGYREQRSEIASIVAGAFGWRALARELVGKIPFGGGLIPKAGIAWAGTFAVGLSLERLYRLGYGFTRAERKAVYEEAYDHGRQIAGMLLEGVRRKKAV